MRRKLLSYTVVAVLGGAFVAVGPAAAAFEMSEAYGVNNVGEAVGWSTTGSGQRHAVYWGVNALGTDLGTLGGVESAANAINDLGEVVGVSRDAGGDDRAFVWSAATGTMRDLGGLPGSVACAARDINDRSQIVGYCYVPSGSGHSQRPVLWSDGVVTDLEAATAGGGRSGSAAGINDRGDVFGEYGDGLWVWSDGTATSLGNKQNSGRPGDINDRREVVGNPTADTGILWTQWSNWYYVGTRLGTLPGGTQSQVHDLNEHGEAVGYGNTSAAIRGFLWANGAKTDLGTLGGASSQAYGVNDRSEVVGSADLTSGDTHAFLWSGGTMTDLGVLP